jgi:hypothetical protein
VLPAERRRQHDRRLVRAGFRHVREAPILPALRRLYTGLKAMTLVGTVFLVMAAFYLLRP